MRDVVTRPALVVALMLGLAMSIACGGSVVHDEPDDAGGSGQGAGAGQGGSGGAAAPPGICGCVVAFGTGAPGCAICGQGASGSCGLCTTEPCSEVLLCLSGGGYTEEALAECFTSFPPTEAQEGEFMAWKALTCVCNACADKCVAPPPPVCGGN